MIFRNARGVTLIELLAALSLFSIVLVIASTVFFQLFKGDDSASNQIEATQLANIALLDLRNQYTKENDRICLRETEASISIQEASNGEIVGNCIEEINPDNPLSVTISTNPGTGKPTTIKTTWINKRGTGIIVDLKNDVIIIDDGYIENEITIDENGNKILGEEGKDFVYQLTEIDDTYTFVGDSGSFQDDLTFINDGNILGIAVFDITGNVTFDGKITFGSNNPQTIELTINGDAVFSDLYFEKNKTQIVVNGSATFTGKIDFNNNKFSSITVTGTAICNNTPMGENIEITMQSNSCNAP